MNMRDFNYFDRSGPWRRHFHLRTWHPYRLSRWWLKEMITWIWNPGLTKPVEASINTRRGGGCYCPTGSQTHLYVRVVGFGFQFWLTRDRGPLPCLCDLAVMTALPDLYAEEIEENGGLEGVERKIGERQKWFRKAGVAG